MARKLGPIYLHSLIGHSGSRLAAIGLNPDQITLSFSKHRNSAFV
jgi:hypothetical protein